MTKPSEEGRIWEWRAFGRVSEPLAAQVRAYPIRFGLSDLRGDDIYFVAPSSEQNVKIRCYPSGRVLKLKVLLETKPGSFELYEESAEYTHQFPVAVHTLKDAARLLAVEPTKLALSKDTLTEQEFVTALSESSPPAIEVTVSKRRSQYRFDDGWLELADVEIRNTAVQSVSIHSPALGIVQQMVDRLQPGDELEPMNYIQACRRWG